MIKLKKILSLLMCCAIIPMSFSSTVTAETEADSTAVDMIKAIGIMKGDTDGSFRPDDTLTRAEFATIISNICNGTSLTPAEEVVEGPTSAMYVDDWDLEFYGGEPKHTGPKKEAPSVGANYGAVPAFRDVKSDHWAYKYIAMVSAAGHMVGGDDGLFEPERTITPTEAVKVMVSLLGYTTTAERLGGYPNGYISQASNLDMLVGIDMSAEAGISRAQIAHLIYNSFDAYVQVMTDLSEGGASYKPSDETFLEHFFNIKKIKNGMLTDNGVSSIHGSSSINSNEITVSNITMTKEGFADVSGYLGCKMTVYYKFDSNFDEANKLIWYTLNPNVRIIDIDASDIDNFSPYQIRYNVGNSAKVYSISTKSEFIYNGSYVTTLEEDMRYIHAGKVRIVDSDEPLIMIWNYRSALVGYVDTAQMKVFDKLAPNDYVLYDQDKTSKYLTFKDQKGNLTTYDAFSSNSVIMIADSADQTEFVACGSTITGTVSAVIDDEGTPKVLIDGVEYEYSYEYRNFADRITLSAGDDATITLNLYNQIVWAVVGGAPGNDIGYIYGSYCDEEDNWVVKMFSSIGTHDTYQVAEKFTIQNSDGTQIAVNKSNVANVLKNYRSFARIMLDEDGYLKKIEMPLDEDNGTSRYHKIFEVAASSNGRYAAATYRNQSFGTYLFVDNSTRVLRVPENIYDENRTIVKGSETAEFDNTDFDITNMSYFSDNNNYSVIGYTDVPDSQNAKYLICYSNNASVDRPKINEGWGVILDRYTGIDTDNEVKDFVKVYYENNTFTLSANENVNFDDVVYDNGIGRGPIGKGDAVYFNKNTRNQVTAIRLIYDADAPDPTTGEKTGYIPGASQYLFINKTKVNPDPSNFVDPYGPSGYIYTRGQHGLCLTGGNPYRTPFNSRGESEATANPFQINENENRILCGYVYSKGVNNVKVTTQNLRAQNATFYPNGVPPFEEAVYQDNYVGVYIVENMRINDNNMKVVKIGKRNGSVTISPAFGEDILSYKEAGSACSKVLYQSGSGYIRNILIYVYED